MTNSKVVVFRCNNEEYAISVDNVISIEKVEYTNPIPHLPDYVDGLTKNRGELLPILDFNKILYSVPAQGELCRVLILRVEDFTFGLKVLDAKEILDVPESQVNQVGLVNYAKTKYFTAVCNLDQRMITIVSAAVLIDSLEGIKEIKQYMIQAKKEQAEAELAAKEAALIQEDEE